ncbi:aspartyl-phosphate phosphatase Spo0E family protein [Ammoniphilus resinae]|uniref:Spo0E like sporulation regulatory protein n=1 Tax=Ammoniphilus resinae TaxID=861532 RepID=A0ABS4GQR2_9BACL|nr:aspartyl-phosphate phosphatase Spo0E family protein [Ammoniphilus resinae]MBP1932586.1 hypothetical protein [Ammoniphilus resinae]
MVSMPSETSSKLNLDLLLEEIYTLRLHLNELSRDMGNLTHPKLVEVSQLLDQKLNSYNQISLRR